MDKLVEGFNLLGLASLAVMTVVVVALTRRVLEVAMPWLIKDEQRTKTLTVVSYTHEVSRIYNELLLYMLPYVWAAVFAAIKSDFLFGSVNTYLGRFFLAFMVATFSGLIYKSVKKAVPGLFGVTVETDDKVLSIPPKE